LNLCLRLERKGEITRDQVLLLCDWKVAIDARVRGVWNDDRAPVYLECLLFEFGVPRLPIASIDRLSPQVRTDQPVLSADIQSKQDH
jgi:hypothetical protein